MADILMIDDDEALCRTLQLQLEDEGHRLQFVGSCAEARLRFDEPDADIVFLDLKLPDGTGLQILPEFKRRHPDLPVVMITSRQDMSATIEAMQKGAFDYLRKPFALDEILLLIEKVAVNRRSDAYVPLAEEEEFGGQEIIGRDPTVLEVLKQIGLLSTSRAPVLILGESGTGKELIARALHAAGDGAGPFVAVNCSAVVPTLFESELFGHEKGSFTGANAQRVGKIEHARRGTLFLDEIGEMPLEQQAKLLRVLQEREFERVGGVEKIPLEARVLAATNRDLSAMVADGSFREDLFYRLAVTTVRSPSLRERRGDIPLLAQHLLRRLSSEMAKPLEGIDEAAMQLLVGYDWPGNVRELENVLTRAIALCHSRIISRDDILLRVSTPKARISPDDILPLRDVEKQHVEKALAVFGWNITHTAQSLDIAQNTLRKKIADFGLEPPK